MASSAESLARELADLRRRLAALERGTQLTTSTVSTSGGTISVVQGLEAGMSAGAAAAEAVARAASAEAKADGAVHTYFGPTAPEQDIHVGDLWRDDEGTVSQFDGVDWVPISGDNPELAADLEEAMDRIAHAEEALDGKVTTYFVSSKNPPPENLLNKGDLWIVSDGGNLIRRWDGTNWIDAPAGAAALADRAVTSTKLETDLVLTSRIIAGEAGGNRAEMNPDGFHVYDASREVMRLGRAGESDYMTIVKADGSSAAGITQEGTVNALGVSAGNKLWYQGREMTTILDEMPLGVLAQGKRTTRGQATSAQNSYLQYMRIDATLIPGRQYRLTVGPIYAAITSPGVLGVAIIYRYDNPATPTLNHGMLSLIKCRTDHDIVAPLSVPFEVNSTDGTARSVSFLVAYCNLAASGYVNLTPDNAQPCPTYFTLEDMGAKYRTVSKGHAGAMNLPQDWVPGILDPVAIDGQPTDRKNYVVNGDTATATTLGGTADEMYQGPWPDHGKRYVSAVWWQGLPEAVTGCDIKGMMLLVNAKQWHYANGGTVTLAPHGWTSLPDSFSLSGLPTFRVESAGFPNPGYRYIPIPAELWDGFKTGRWRGFVFVGDETLDSSGKFGNNPEVNPDLQLPVLQVGVTINATGSIA